MKFLKYCILVLALTVSSQAWADAPAVTTLSASSVGPVATLNGSVNPGGTDTTAWFEWGLVANYYTNATTAVSVGSGGGSVAVSNLLSGITPGFVYHYRVVASNAFGIVHGRDVPFGSPAIVLNGGSSVTNEVHLSFVDSSAVATGGLLEISSGIVHGLALKSDGTVGAWGSERYGVTNVPNGLSNVVAIAAGGSHNLVLKYDGTITAWGTNDVGQTNIPAGLTNVQAIASGYDFNLALKSDGTVAAWGDNSYGQTNIPSGLSNVVSIAGGGWHALALKGDGTVVAWGDNGQGQTNVPFGLSNVVAVAGGGWHSLALKNDGTIVGWGENQDGQATAPEGLSDVAMIAAGGYHSVALKKDGTLAVWGWNFVGQTNVPADLSNVVSVAAGHWNSLALRSDGTVVPWGAGFTNTGFINYGQSLVPADLNKLAVTVSGSVDTNTTGSYVLTYISSNSSGGVATVTRTVVIVDAAPVINPPVLTGFVTLDNGTFQFGFTNASGASFTVFASTNVTLPLESWTNLGPAVETPASSGQFQFSDPQATNLGQRFYRVRSP